MVSQASRILKNLTIFESLSEVEAWKRPFRMVTHSSVEVRDLMSSATPLADLLSGALEAVKYVPYRLDLNRRLCSAPVK